MWAEEGCFVFKCVFPWNLVLDLWVIRKDMANQGVVMNKNVLWCFSKAWDRRRQRQTGSHGEPQAKVEVAISAKECSVIKGPQSGKSKVHYIPYTVLLEHFSLVICEDASFCVHGFKWTARFEQQLKSMAILWNWMLLVWTDKTEGKSLSARTLEEFILYCDFNIVLCIWPFCIVAIVLVYNLWTNQAMEACNYWWY